MTRQQEKTMSRPGSLAFFEELRRLAYEQEGSTHFLWPKREPNDKSVKIIEVRCPHCPGFIRQNEQTTTKNKGKSTIEPYVSPKP